MTASYFRENPEPGGADTTIYFLFENDGHFLFENDGPPPFADTDMRRLLELVGETLTAEGASGHLDVTFVSEAVISGLNEEHMGSAGPTDVLSFPLEPFSDDPSDDAGPGMQRLIGDIFVCPEVAHRQAPDHAGTYLDELALLLVHSCLHICGYDHADPSGRDAMWTRERSLLAEHWTQLPRDPWA